MEDLLSDISFDQYEIDELTSEEFEKSLYLELLAIENEPFEMEVYCL